MSRVQLRFWLGRTVLRDFICVFIGACGWGCRKSPISEFPINEYIVVWERRVRAVAPLGNIKYAVGAAPTKEPTDPMP